jgi:hypothetical protein
MNRIPIKNIVKKILKEDVENNLYKKIATIVKPPYVTDMYKMGLSNSEIKKVLEVIFGMELKIDGIDNGGDVFVLPYFKVKGHWIYYEMFDGSGWEIVDRDEQGAIVRKYGFDGDDYYDQIVGANRFN